MSTQPTLFISHGGPNIVTDDSLARSHLMSLAEMLPQKPSAIIVASAHFETEGASVVSDPAPGMIYDFGGFAPELYEMVYAAPGSPKLAERVMNRIKEAGLPVRLISERGYDHGSWTPLILAFPEADIPIVQVSIDPQQDAAYHHRLGAALSGFAGENTLIIGSGHITHNLRSVFSVMRGGKEPDPAVENKVVAFTDWMADALSIGDTEHLLNWRDQAPFPLENHPTDEHLMPIFFAAGAAGDKAMATRIHASRQMGFFAFDCYRFDQALTP